MSDERPKSEQVESLFDAPDLAEALESDQFKHFLDQLPIGIAVSEMKSDERIVYINLEFERISGQAASDVVGNPWSVLPTEGGGGDGLSALAAQVVADSDFVGTFKLKQADGGHRMADAYSNVIADERGNPRYRLVALVDVTDQAPERSAELEAQIRDKDTLLREIQHRVKNNLQMITALIRIEARNARGVMDTQPFERLVGRIEAIQIIYKLLSENQADSEIDLGVYLGEIASAVMKGHAVEGIRLELKVDTYPVSINVAMPTGLVVNELLTNALKHAFVGRDGGTITLHSLSDGADCRILVADDGIGLPTGAGWPQHGKLSALIVQSLRENAKAAVTIASEAGKGMRVEIVFSRSAASC